MSKYFYIITLSLLVVGCSSKNNLEDIQTVSLPNEWNINSEDNQKEISQTWWQSFGSIELDSLILQAKNDSLDLQVAINRIKQARAKAKIAGADLYPQIGASLDASRKGSLNHNGNTNNFSSNLEISYEIDFWGKNRAFYESASENLKATIFQKDELELSMVSNVTMVYLNIVALNDKINIAKLNLKTAKELYELIQSKYDLGASTKLELTQQEILFLQQQKVLVELENELDETNKILSTLLAKTSNVEVHKISLNDIQIPNISSGLPSQLLLRRPDIAQSEALMKSANANIDVARAEMFPSLNLVGGLGTNAEKFSNIFDKPIYTLLSALKIPIFYGGKLSANYDLSQAEYEEMLINYRKTIINAFWEVDIALRNIENIDRQIQLQNKELEQSQLALNLSLAQYKVGATTLMDLLDTQRNLYSAKDVSVQLKLKRLILSVELYKALGGGWKV
ncbi:efflux transporter outer membrane subunit [Aliarcobacter lanthieri]|uniref:efflux transporter outer membrane subunit n=1 Tax=Aliarcobacter lanthieri TaxID=1355374 RepID=UPI003AAD0B11